MTNDEPQNSPKTDPQNATKSAPKWKDKWKHGRIKTSKDGRDIYVLEKKINGKRYVKTLPDHVKDEDDALAEWASFKRNPDAYCQEQRKEIGPSTPALTEENTSRTDDKLQEVSEEALGFPFEYVGGGYWRKRGVPRGEKAETLHGDEAIEKARAELVEEIERLRELAAWFKLRLHAAHSINGNPEGCDYASCNEAIRKMRWGPRA
jgi:hypothetical protein